MVKPDYYEEFTHLKEQAQHYREMFLMISRRMLINLGKKERTEDI